MAEQGTVEWFNSAKSYGFISRRMARIFLYVEKGQTLIFARTKRGTERLAKNLIREGFTAAMIHGDRSQSQRTGALNGFEQGKFQVLVATDLASRGIHVNNVAHVINYDLPQIPEDFIHRVGRTARMGSRGRASMLVSGGGNRRAAFDGTCTQVKNRSPAIRRRHANTATGSPEHPSNAHSVPHGRRSILVNSTEPRNAYNQCVSHVRDGSISPSRMVGRRHNSRLPSPALS